MRRDVGRRTCVAIETIGRRVKNRVFLAGGLRRLLIIGVVIITAAAHVTSVGVREREREEVVGTADLLLQQ